MFIRLVLVLEELAQRNEDRHFSGYMLSFLLGPITFGGSRLSSLPSLDGEATESYPSILNKLWQAAMLAAKSRRRCLSNFLNVGP